MSISEHEAKTLADFETYEAEVATLRARVAELERERDEARKLLEYSGGANLLSDLNAARADAARLREALEALVEYERKRHPPKMGGDHLPPTLREVMDIARAAIASAPSAEPTPRDMRVAEAVREEVISVAVRWPPGMSSGDRSNMAATIRSNVSLAAVVAKAVGT